MNITPDTPEAARNRRFQAQALSATCTGCGEVNRKDNLLSMNDGSRLCGPCADALMDAMFAAHEAEQERRAFENDPF